MVFENPIILGVITGVLTSAFISICIVIFNKVLIPFYRASIYRGLDINGNWDSSHEHSKANDSIRIFLKQKEQNIKGTLTVFKRIEGNEIPVHKTLKLEGSFIDGHLMLTGNNKDTRYRSHVTFLGEIKNGGDSIIGLYSFLDGGSNRLRSIETEFIRSPA